MVSKTKRGAIVVNGQHFTKGELRIFVQGILDRYNDGESLNLPDLCFCKSLLERHPESAGKIGDGVRAVRVVVFNPWKTKGFVLVRTDGTEIDFSFRACIESKGMSHYDEVQKAARTCIHPQIIAFKKAHTFGGRLKCAETGQSISWADCQIDHYPTPFSVLFKQFVAIEGIDIKTIKLIKEVEVLKFADPALEQSFWLYHLENAQLRPTRDEVNNQLGCHAC